MLPQVMIGQVPRFEPVSTARLNIFALNINTEVDYQPEFKLVFSWVNYPPCAFHINCVFNISNCHEDDFQIENYLLIQLTCYVNNKSTWEYLGLLHVNGFSEEKYDTSCLLEIVSFSWTWTIKVLKVKNILYWFAASFC